MNLKTVKRYLPYAYLLFFFAASSCVGIKKSQLKFHLETSICNQLNPHTSQKALRPLQETVIDTVLSNRLSNKSLNVAHAINILDLLTAYINIQKKYAQEPTLENQVEKIALSQKINRKINISAIEISAVSSEIDCEEERANQIANYLKNEEEKIGTRLTVSAIVTGATGAIFSGLILSRRDNLNNELDYIGIGIGITEATLGLLILLNKKKINFYHQRNVLREILEGPETSTIFPPSVWYHLNHQESQETLSLRGQIIENWENFEQIAIKQKKKKKEKDYKIYFREGGQYNSEQLTTRANMLDQVEAHVSLMQQDLKQLAIEIERIERE